MRRLLASAPGGFNATMGEILKKYAHVLDTSAERPNNERAQEVAVAPARGFVPYAESGGRKKPGGFYSEKPEGEPRGYSSSGHGRKEMEGEVYRQTRAADVDAEKAFEKMAYGGTGEPKRKKSPYAHD